MTVSYRFGDLDARRATIRARALLGAEHYSVIRRQKLQTAASNVAGTDSAVGSNWG